MVRRGLLAGLALLLLPALVSAYTIILKDGQRIEAQARYTVEAGIARFVDMSGQAHEVPLAQIDVAATRRANRRVWTNDELQLLRARSRLSVVGRGAAAAPAQPAAAVQPCQPIASQAQAAQPTPAPAQEPAAPSPEGLQAEDYYEEMEEEEGLTPPEPEPSPPPAEQPPAAASALPPCPPAGAGQPVGQAPSGPAPGEEQPPKEETREYWGERLKPLRDELTTIEQQLRQLRQSQGQAASNAITVTQGNPGVQVEDTIRRLEQRRAQINRQIEDLQAEARRKGVPPGWVR